MNLTIATLFWVDWKCPKKSDMKPDPSGPSGSTGWWQLKYFPFSIPLPWGFMIQFDLRIFFRRVGWNHQLSGNGLGWWFGLVVWIPGSPYESAIHWGTACPAAPNSPSYGVRRSQRSSQRRRINEVGSVVWKSCRLVVSSPWTSEQLCMLQIVTKNIYITV